MVSVLEGEILGDRERNTRREEPLYRRVAHFVYEGYRPFERACLLKRLPEKEALPRCDAHRAEDDREVRRLRDLCLPDYLEGEFLGRQSRAREDGEFLPPHERI